MVVKRYAVIIRKPVAFESRVILDGSQTFQLSPKDYRPFESRVILDGSQTTLL